MLMAFLSSTKLVESAVLFFACARSALRCARDRRFSAFAHNDWLAEAERNVSSTEASSAAPDSDVSSSGIQLVGESQHDLVECAGLSGVLAGVRQRGHRRGHLVGRGFELLIVFDADTHVGDRLGFVTASRACGGAQFLAEPCMRR